MICSWVQSWLHRAPKCTLQWQCNQSLFSVAPDLKGLDGHLWAWHWGVDMNILFSSTMHLFRGEWISPLLPINIKVPLQCHLESSSYTQAVLIGQVLTSNQKHNIAENTELFWSNCLGQVISYLFEPQFITCKWKMWKGKKWVGSDNFQDTFYDLLHFCDFHPSSL